MAKAKKEVVVAKPNPKRIYIDMDGVLANFDGMPNALERFAVEDEFFLKLEPLPLAAKLNKALENQALRDYVYILSASPRDKADDEKRVWLKKYVPNLKPENIITVRFGDKKKLFAQANRILVDDYSGNLKEWEQRGGTAIKFANGKNNKSGQWVDKKVFTENNEIWELLSR